jgi:hypothetical protein
MPGFLFITKDEPHGARSNSMKKYLVAAVMIVAFAGPAFAEDFYVAADLASGKCEMMNSMPDAKKYKMMGKFATKAEAETAMHGMKDCK